MLNKRRAMHPPNRRLTKIASLLRYLLLAGQQKSRAMASEARLRGLDWTAPDYLLKNHSKPGMQRTSSPQWRRRNLRASAPLCEVNWQGSEPC
jgi:hypothetical protein